MSEITSPEKVRGDILPPLLLESTVQSLGHIPPRSGETPQKLLTVCASVLRVLSEITRYGVVG